MKVTRLIPLVLMLFWSLLFTACTQLDEPPGVGEKAERGYTVCAPIINALEQYQLKQGTYPESLTELVPDYMSAIPSEVNDNPISYQKTTDGFSLSFHYIGPGMNTCTYTPENAWHCSGAY